MPKIDTPLEFATVSNELLIDPRIIDEVGMSIASFALMKVRPSEAPVIRAFVASLLSGRYSDHDLEEWWANLSVGFHFFGGSGVRVLLRSLRDELEKPRYFA